MIFPAYVGTRHELESLKELGGVLIYSQRSIPNICFSFSFTPRFLVEDANSCSRNDAPVVLPIK